MMQPVSYYTASEPPISSQRMLVTSLFMLDVEMTSSDMDTTYKGITTPQFTITTESVLTSINTILATESTLPLTMSLSAHVAGTTGSSYFTEQMFKSSDINVLSTMGDGMSTHSNKGASTFIVCTPVTRSFSVIPSINMALESTDSEMTTSHLTDANMDKVSQLVIPSSMHTLPTSSSLYATPIIDDKHTDMDTTELFTIFNGLYSRALTTRLQSNSLPTFTSVRTIISKRDSTVSSVFSVSTKSTPMGISIPTSSDSMQLISTEKVLKETSYMLTWTGGFASKMKSLQTSFSEFTTTRKSTVLATSPILDVTTTTELTLTSTQTLLLEYTPAYNSTDLMTVTIQDIMVGATTVIPSLYSIEDTSQINITGTKHVMCLQCSIIKCIESEFNLHNTVDTWLLNLP